MAARYRCGACGNVTRFDVVATRRTRAFHHYSIAGELRIEDEEVLDERVERVVCRWCNASDAQIERFEAGDRGVDASAGSEPAPERPGGEAAASRTLRSEQLHDQTS
jgi:hypothetical protein